MDDAEISLYTMTVVFIVSTFFFFLAEAVKGCRQYSKEDACERKYGATFENIIEPETRWETGNWKVNCSADDIYFNVTDNITVETYYDHLGIGVEIRGR